MNRSSSLTMHKVLPLALALLLAAGCLPLYTASAFAGPNGGNDAAGQSGSAAASAASASAASEAKTDGILLVLDGNSEEAISLLSAGEGENELTDAGLVVNDYVETADNTLVLAAQATQGQSVEEALVDAADLPGVAYAQPN